MNTPFFIAKRYLLARKSHNLINIITWISIIGISVASFALIVVLSAFNGLEDVVASLNHQLNPDIQIAPVRGKTIALSAFPMDRVKSLDGVEYAVPTLSEDALFRANDKQHIGIVKGVGHEYAKMNRIMQTAADGNGLVFSEGGYDLAVPGTGVAWYLGISDQDPYAVIRIYVPKRGNASSFNLENSFNSGALTVRSVFSTSQEIDENHVLVPFSWLSDLSGYDNEASNVELFLKQGADVTKVKKAVKSMLGESFTVKDQREQQETLYKIMHTEKWAVYLILTFILFLATFNVVGSLSMLMIDKRKDVEVLKSLGANKRFFFRLFMNEGMLISVAGGVLGLILGMLVVLLQQKYGFVKFGTGGNYVVDAYPVLLRLTDVLAIFATIIVIGCTSAFFTVRHALKGSFSGSTMS